MIKLIQKSIHFEKSFETVLFHNTAGRSNSVTSMLSSKPHLHYHTITSTAQVSYFNQSSLNPKTTYLSPVFIHQDVRCVRSNNYHCSKKLLKLLFS